MNLLQVREFVSSKYSPTIIPPQTRQEPTCFDRSVSRCFMSSQYLNLLFKEAHKTPRWLCSPVEYP
eukprot:scaffold53436_cov28-Prasinocladus_malaysianus.AAC.2